MFRKAVQRGRSELGTGSAEGGACPAAPLTGTGAKQKGASPPQPLSDARTKLADFFNILLGSFTIDDDRDPIHARLHRLTHPFQISTLWHGLAGL